MLKNKKLFEDYKTLSQQTEQMVSSFKQKAKQYEEYLVAADDVLEVAILSNNNAFELIDKIFANASTLSELEVSKETKIFKDSEQFELFSISLKRLENSETLRKKRLFLEIGGKFKNMLGEKSKEIQPKYDTFLGRLKFNLSCSFQNRQNEPFSMGTENSSNLDSMNINRSSGTPNEIEGSLAVKLASLNKLIVMVGSLIDKSSLFTIDNGSFKDLIQNFKKLLLQLMNYCLRCKRELESKKGVDQEKLIQELKSEFDTFNQEIDQMRESVQVLEKVDGLKLEKLSNENKNLKLIKSHIETLEMENKKISSTLVSFNLMIIDRERYIKALENNLDEKRDLLKIRKTEFKALEEKGDVISETLESKLETLIGWITRPRQPNFGFGETESPE